jgi:hypothetical protein
MIRQWLAKQLWNFSEWSGIGLGRFAPYVFGLMIGRKGKRVQMECQDCKGEGFYRVVTEPTAQGFRIEKVYCAHCGGTGLREDESDD